MGGKPAAFAMELRLFCAVPSNYDLSCNATGQLYILNSVNFAHHLNMVKHIVQHVTVYACATKRQWLPRSGHG